MPAAPELEIFMVGCKLVAIEHDLDLATVTWAAAKHLMLAAVAEFAQIGVSAVRRRHAGIVFLDPAAHFRNQRLLQARGVAEQALGINVFGFEMVSDIRVQT